MVSIDFNSAMIDVDTAGVIPRVDFTGRFSVCHLTRGARLPAAPPDPNDEKNSPSGFSFSPAIKMTGTVAFLRDPADSFSGFGIGFVQFTNLMARSGTWGGRVNAEGSTSVDFGAMMQKNPSLDANPPGSTSNFPMTETTGSDTSEAPDGAQIRRISTIKMGDHPNSWLPIMMPNDSTGVSNYLYQQRLDLELTTVLVVSDPKNALIPVAHFKWHLVYDVRVRWVLSAPYPTMVAGRLDVGPTVLGPPTDASMRGMLANPSPEVPYNVLVDKASKKTVPRETFFRDQSIIPNDFFK